MFHDFITNKPLWIAAFGFLSSQLFKFIIGLITGKKTKLMHFFGTGGMPSSHATTTGALAASIGISAGLGSPEFALAAIFCAVVIYDATNIRRAAGKNATTINHIVDKLHEHWENDSMPETLKTKLGHSNPEVIVGLIWGISLAIITHLILGK